MKEKTMLIRGHRVINQLNDLETITEQSTFNQLKTNVDNFTPQGSDRGKGDGSKRLMRQHAVDDIHLSNPEFVAAKGMKSLKLTAIASSGSGDKAYSPIIIFNRVEFEDEDSQDNITIDAVGGEIHFKKINLAANTLRVRCNCADFYWRFAAFNAKDKSLDGRSPKPYQRKTNRGPANPQQVPGMCKHLLKLMKMMQDDGAVS